MGVISVLLDHDAPNGGRLPKIIVVDQDQAPMFDALWNSDLGNKLKAMKISLRENGFEFRSPDQED
jgi:hypothetical protein